MSRYFTPLARISSLSALLALLAACGDDKSGTAADRLLVGAQCQTQDDCRLDEQSGDVAKQCLLQFKGGYCAIDGCEGDSECPSGSACVTHSDGNTYCFRLCSNKPDCNRNRDPDNESNCSSNVTFVEHDSGKACVPPSG
jgi:hypothetical protein